MLIRKFFGETSSYIGDFKQIRYSPPIIGLEGDNNWAFFFESGLKSLKSLVHILIEDKKLDNTQPISDFDEATLSYMRLAIECGKKSVEEEGKLTPKVGAVLIKEKQFLGSSYRGQKGKGDHAEYTLFEKILTGIDIKGSTLFTTLEPCTARGSHKPCCDWVIEKGIKNVYVGLLDPNPKIYNIGCKKMIAAGINVNYFPRELRKEISQDNIQFVSQYNANSDLNGLVSFNYTDNNGKFLIGNGELLFETMWTKASDQAIHIYNDPASIRTVSIAEGFKEIYEVKDGTIYNTTSRARTVHIDEIVILENNNGYFAAIKILDIKDKSRPNNDRDELRFEYIILPDNTYDFTKSK